MLENLEIVEAEFGSVRGFLLELKREFGREDKELVKVGELKKMEQEGKIMEKFV